MIRFLAHTIFVALALIAACLIAPASAQTAREKDIAASTRDLDRIERALGARDADIRALESDLRRLISTSRGHLGPLDNELAAADDRLAILPPAPKEGESELAEIAVRRATLRAERDALLLQQQSVLANIDEASRLLSEISAGRLRRLYAGLLTRGEPLVSPGLWAEGA